MVIPVNVSLCSRALGSCVASSFIVLEASECAWRLEPSYKILLLCWEYLHAPCSLLLTPKEFLTRPVLGIVLPCRIPMLGYLKCFPAAPPGVLEFIDIGGDFSLKNWSVTRPGTKQEVMSSLGSYYIKCVGLLVGKVEFMTSQISQPPCKPLFLSKALNCRVFFIRALSFLFCCVWEPHTSGQSNVQGQRTSGFSESSQVRNTSLVPLF